VGNVANDLDLDELHEAVSALMDQSKNRQVERPSHISEPRPAEPPAEQPAVKSTSSNLSVAEPTSADDKIEVRRPLPNIAVGRPRGRAMDVVSPKPVSVIPTVTKVNRTGMTLQPASPEPEPVKAEEKPTEASTLPKDEPERPPLNYQKPIEDSWPDPLDMHGDEQKTEAAPTMTEAPESKTDPATPLASPFLNTKVEKRPLGAYTSEEPAATPTSKPDFTEDDQILNIASQQQPKELSPDVVAVESAEPEQTTDFAFEDEAQDTRQATIPQQYQTAQKDSSTGSRPIFDTKDYHPPIAAHAAHRTSSAMGWVLITVFAVILIAALLFAFYMVTGGLDFSVLFR
jgi:hypothetical protein